MLQTSAIDTANRRLDHKGRLLHLVLPLLVAKEVRYIFDQVKVTHAPPLALLPLSLVLASLLLFLDLLLFVELLGCFLGCGDLVDDQVWLFLHFFGGEDFVLVDPMQQPSIRIVDSLTNILPDFMLHAAHGKQAHIATLRLNFGKVGI